MVQSTIPGPGGTIPYLSIVLLLVFSSCVAIIFTHIIHMSSRPLSATDLASLPTGMSLAMTFRSQQSFERAIDEKDH